MHGAYHAVLEDRETLATNSTGTNKTLEPRVRVDHTRNHA
jgi:hypothetical protein